MAGALVDTNVFFASVSASDDYHDRARAIVHGIDHGELPDSVITDYVLAETLNLTREKLGAGPANRLLDRLIEGAHFEIVRAPKTDFSVAQSVFRRYSELSFVDATVVAYLRREDVEYLYSFDDDFDAVDGVARLDTAADPFG